MAAAAPPMEKLFHKRGSIREEGLTALIKQFKTDIRLEFAQKNYFTILSRCENSIKKGSAAEIKLAAQTIGLLALTVGPGDCANEIYDDTLRMLPQALKSKAQHIAILECLAIVTFVRDNDFDETERTMRIIWEYINKKFLEKDADPIIGSAISAWSFLLAKADHHRLDNKFWKRVIPFFLELLESKYKDNDEYAFYSPVVEEALAIVFDKVCQHKFCSETDETSDTRVLDVAGVEDDENAIDAKHDVSDLLKEYRCHQTSINIRRNIFILASWSDQIKMNYLKQFLGDSFKKHIVDNDFLRNVFKCKIEECTGPTLYVPEEKEVTVEVYIPGVRDIRNRERLINNSRNSILSKGKTQYRNKLRTIAQEKNHCFIYDEIN